MLANENMKNAKSAACRLGFCGFRGDGISFLGKSLPK
jgi:hypothetical protein